MTMRERIRFIATTARVVAALTFLYIAGRNETHPFSRLAEFIRNFQQTVNIRTDATSIESMISHIQTTECIVQYAITMILMILVWVSLYNQCLHRHSTNNKNNEKETKQQRAILTNKANRDLQKQLTPPQEKQENNLDIQEESDHLEERLDDSPSKTSPTPVFDLAVQQVPMEPESRDSEGSGYEEGRMQQEQQRQQKEAKPAIFAQLNCQSCNHKLETTWKFCCSCGTPTSMDSDAVTAVQSSSAAGTSTRGDEERTPVVKENNDTGTDRRTTISMNNFVTEQKITLNSNKEYSLAKLYKKYPNAVQKILAQRLHKNRNSRSRSRGRGGNKRQQQQRRGRFIVKPNQQQQQEQQHHHQQQQQQTTQQRSKSVGKTNDNYDSATKKSNVESILPPRSKSTGNISISAIPNAPRLIKARHPPVKQRFHTRTPTRTLTPSSVYPAPATATEAARAAKMLRENTYSARTPPPPPPPPPSSSNLSSSPLPPSHDVDSRTNDNQGVFSRPKSLQRISITSSNFANTSSVETTLITAEEDSIPKRTPATATSPAPAPLTTSKTSISKITAPTSKQNRYNDIHNDVDDNNVSDFMKFRKTDSTCIGSRMWPLCQLIEQYPPPWGHANKRLIAKIAFFNDNNDAAAAAAAAERGDDDDDVDNNKNAENNNSHYGLIRASRWYRPHALPKHVKRSKIELEEKPEQGNNDATVTSLNASSNSKKRRRSAVHWYMNFGGGRLFRAGEGPSIDTDELQILEHPCLASLAIAIDDYMTHHVEGLSSLTYESALGPTPILIKGALKSCCIDTNKLTTETFDEATEDQVRFATKQMSIPTTTNILVMPSVNPGNGKYTLSQIKRLFIYAYTGFRAIVLESGGNKRVVLHTGFWGCDGELHGKGNKGLATAIQILAAGTAGIQYIHFKAPCTLHDTSALQHGIDIANALHDKSFEVAINFLATSGYTWGNGGPSNLPYQPPPDCVWTN